MAWNGKISTRASGGLVPQGKVALPRQISVIGTGDGVDPDIRVDFALSDDGEARCTEVRVSAKDLGRGVRVSDLTMIGIDALGASAFSDLAEPIVSRDEGEFSIAIGGSRTSPDEWAGSRVVSKGKGVTMGELVEVAWVYANAKKAPVSEVEVRLALRRRTAMRRVEAARNERLLPPKGKPVTDEHRRIIGELRDRLSARTASDGHHFGTKPMPVDELIEWLGWQDRPELKGNQNG